MSKHMALSSNPCTTKTLLPPYTYILTYSFLDLFVSYPAILFHRHFLFKTGTGTTPLFSTATPGYTMASGSVYSPPTRPLPRNTLSRSAFKFKKSSKYCSWKCTALCAVGVSVLLAILLSYFIGKNRVLDLFVNWALYGCFATFIYLFIFWSRSLLRGYIV
jgi:hypothetical protein